MSVSLDKTPVAWLERRLNGMRMLHEVSSEEDGMLFYVMVIPKLFSRMPHSRHETNYMFEIKSDVGYYCEPMHYEAKEGGAKI